MIDSHLLIPWIFLTLYERCIGYMPLVKTVFIIYINVSGLSLEKKNAVQTPEKQWFSLQAL